MTGGPVGDDADRVRQAVIHQAVRFAGLLEAPLGQLGTEFGPAPVRVNYSLNELLYGMRGQYDPAGLVGFQWPTSDDVIRAGFGADVAAFPTDRRPDVDRALAAGISDVTKHLTFQQWPGVG